MICQENHEDVVGAWSAAEGLGVLWLIGEEDGQRSSSEQASNQSGRKIDQR